MSGAPEGRPGQVDRSRPPNPPPPPDPRAVPHVRFPNPPEYQYPNPPEKAIPDPITLGEQWQYAKRQYSRYYSQAWGSAILAGAALFALGWFIKGENPLAGRLGGGGAGIGGGGKPAAAGHAEDRAGSRPEQK